MKDNLLELLQEGFFIQFKSLSICDLRHYGQSRRKYQVHHENKYSEIFNDINEAVDKFLDIKSKYEQPI